MLSNFNINGFTESARLLHILSGYSPVVQVSTHISGSSLDHCYVHRKFSETFSVDVFDIYFIDHDAVRLRFT